MLPNVGVTLSFHDGIRVSPSTDDERERLSSVVRRQNGSGFLALVVAPFGSQTMPSGRVGAITADTQITSQLEVGVTSHVFEVPHRMHLLHVAHCTPMLPHCMLV